MVSVPFTRYGGSLSHIRLDDLLGMTMKGACERVGVGLDQIEDIVAGATFENGHLVESPDDAAAWGAMLSDRPLLRNVAEQCLNRSERVVVVRERASAKLSDRKLVREHVAEERCPGTSREVLVQLPEMRHEQLRDDDERTHLKLVWQHGYSRTARRPDSVRKPFGGREAGGVVAKMLVYRGESLILEFVQRGPHGAIPGGARMAFREPGCPNARNLGLDQDANTSQDCRIQQIVRHSVIAHEPTLRRNPANLRPTARRVHSSSNSG